MTQTTVHLEHNIDEERNTHVYIDNVCIRRHEDVDNASQSPHIDKCTQELKSYINENIMSLSPSPILDEENHDQESSSERYITNQNDFDDSDLSDLDDGMNTSGSESYPSHMESTDSKPALNSID
eukprot:1152585_1